MNDETGSGKPERKPIGGELVIPVAAFVFTLYYFWTIIDVPRIAQVSAFFVGTILIGLIGLFFYRIYGQVSRGEADLRVGPLFEPKNYIPKRLALLGIGGALTDIFDRLLGNGGQYRFQSPAGQHQP